MLQVCDTIAMVGIGVIMLMVIPATTVAARPKRWKKRAEVEPHTLHPKPSRLRLACPMGEPKPESPRPYSLTQPNT